MHERRRREVTGSGDPVEVSLVERHEPAGGIEHVDDGGILGVGVAHGSRDDAGHPDLAGQREHPTGLAEAAGQVLGAAVADQLDDDGALRHPGHPALEGGAGLGVLLREHRPPHVGVGAEQDDEGPRLVLRAGMGGDELGGGDGVAALTTQVRCGHEPAHRRPPRTRGQSEGTAAAPGEHRDPRQSWVDESTTTNGCTALPTGTAPFTKRGLECEIDPEDRCEVVLHAGPHELHGTVEPVAVGEGEGRLAPGGGSLDELVRFGGAVAHGVAARDMEVHEALHITLGS